MSMGKGSKYEPDWDKLVNCIDVDGDGKIGFDEFVTAASDRYRLIMGEGHLKHAFDMLDGDKDGLISVEELKKAFAYGHMGALDKTEKSSKVDDALWDELLSDIDKDGDGKINFKEFSDHMMLLVHKGHYGNRNIGKPDKQVIGTSYASTAMLST